MDDPGIRLTGHPYVDVGFATIAAHAHKSAVEEIRSSDLAAAAEYMRRNYVVNPLKSFLTVVFPNSGFTQPAYEKTPENRDIYAANVLGAYSAAHKMITWVRARVRRAQILRRAWLREEMAPQA